MQVMAYNTRVSSYLQYYSVGPLQDCLLYSSLRLRYSAQNQNLKLKNSRSYSTYFHGDVAVVLNPQPYLLTAEARCYPFALLLYVAHVCCTVPVQYSTVGNCFLL
jgi:hypothetical protein